MTCLGFLGTTAPNAADINLLAQMVAYLLLLAGVWCARGGKLGTHSRFMKTAILFEFAALALWMGPSLLMNIGALMRYGSGPFITAMHVLGGALALILAIIAAYHRTIGSRPLRWTMRLTMLIWTLAVVLGVSFYANYYLL